MYKNVHNITAGAGAGKTTKLVEIITDLVQNKNAAPRRMILTTFTDAAATEFRERSKAKLAVDKAVEMNAATMGTLHSIAGKYIKRYWYLLGISPSVKPAAPSVSEILMNRSLESVVTGEQNDLLKHYAESFGLTKLDEGYDYDFWKKTLKDMFATMRKYGFGKDRIPEFRDNTMALLRNTFNQNGNAALLEGSRPCMERYIQYKDVVEAHATDAGKNIFAKNYESIRNTLSLNPLKIKIKDLDELGKMTWGRAVSFEPKFAEKKRYEDEISFCKQDVSDAVKRLSATLVPCEHTLIFDVTTLLFDILGAWMDSYERVKNESGVIDFTDMEALFLQLLEKPEVLEDIKKSVDYLFVDEFQDSNPIQARIYDILSNNIRQSWFVGDRKQAIYGFAGSDAGLISELTQCFPAPDSGKDTRGNSSQILNTSHRSVPKLVHAANDIFIDAFASGGLPGDNIPAEQVMLKPADNITDTPWDPLYHVAVEGGNNMQRADALATFVCEMASSQGFRDAGYRLSDIAILARDGSQVLAIGNALTRKRIPTAFIDTKGFRDTPDVSLLMAILRLSDGIDVALSRAEIRKLLLNEDLAGLAGRIANDSNTLDDLAGLEDFAKSLRHHSVPDRVNEIISRFDLYGICGHWGNPDSRRGHVNLVRDAAKEYTDKSSMLCVEADVRGFLSFLDDYKPEPKFDNTADGVKILTYHKAKGLEWKIVILYSLDGYKQVSSISGITILGKSSRPDGILAVPRLPEKDWVKNRIEGYDDSREILLNKRDAQLGEEKRLLYVGFTRARDVVITVSQGTDPEVIDTLCPTAAVRTEKEPDGDKLDIWGIPGVTSRFASYTDNPGIEFDAVRSALKYKDSGFFLPSDMLDNEGRPKYNSPSKWEDESVQSSAVPEAVKDFGERTDISHKHMDDNVFGDCIHHIFAACTPGEHESNLAVAKRTLKAFGIDDADAPSKLIARLESFYSWMIETYGPANALESELPVRYSDDEGRVFSGDMDLVWITEKGCVLVDYKTFSGTKADLFDIDNKHWAGKYASQLHIYSKALEGSDQGFPLDKLLFYPVEGIVIRINSK